MHRLINLVIVLAGAVLLCGSYAVAASDRSGFDKALLTNERYATLADFNGDGAVDYAWLELDEGDCLLIAEVAGRQYVLDRLEGRGSCANLYVTKFVPGSYATACARGLGTGCRPDELRSITLVHTGLLYGIEESSGYLWYWTGDGFSEVWMYD